ncbi:MAG: 3-deoxy-manno-octulosonate cytidylyltransferase [Pseudomonadota bacterium]
MIVPARYASTRLPGKPLRLIDGRAMILHVVDRARSAGAASVTVATDDERILQTVLEANLEEVGALLTSPDHPSGSDRVMEAAQALGLDDDALVINVQGDEPRIPASAIEAVARALAERPELGAATLAQPFANQAHAQDPNLVKVVRSVSGRALYFSRSVIPYLRDGPESAISVEGAPTPFLHHVGIYGFRLATLRRFVRLPVATLEAQESLEQLRLLANDMDLHVALAPEPVPAGVDTEADLTRIRSDAVPSTHG